MTTIISTPKRVTIFGGSGFLGRHVVRALAGRGYRVLVASRKPGLANHLQPLGVVGQIHAVQADILVRWSVDRAVAGADHVVNLTGILSESGKQRFRAIHVDGARAVAEAARAADATLIHVSALTADATSPSLYNATKAEGEAAVSEIAQDAAILRPSIIFGPEDRFFNRFAGMARFMPVLPLIGGGYTRFQPVYVGDVAEAIARLVDGSATMGQTYEIGGPEVLTFRQCMDAVLKATGRHRRLVTIPWGLARLQAAILGRLPKPLLTTDQVLQLQSDAIVSPQAQAEGRTLDGMGIRPQGIDALLATYLWRYRPAGQFTRSTSA